MEVQEKLASGSKKSPASGGKSSVVHRKIELQQKIRMQHCQPWVAIPLTDVVRGRCLRPCKKLPGPDKFAKLPSKFSAASGEKSSSASGEKLGEKRSSASGEKRSLAASASGKKQSCKKQQLQSLRRESLLLWRRAHNPSVLPQALWRCMNVHTKSIGADLLPGERFR